MADRLRLHVAALLEEEELLYLAAAAVGIHNLARLRCERHNRKQRMVWSRLWLQRRSVYGQYATLLQELHREDLSEYNDILFPFRIFVVRIFFVVELGMFLVPLS